MAYETPPSWDEMNKDERNGADYAWSLGKFDAFVIPHQRKLWALICAHMGLETKYELPEEFKDALTRTSTRKPLVIEVARRFGKTSLVLLAMMALCIRNKGYTYHFLAPDQESASEIIGSVFPNLIATCPPKRRPTKKAKEFVFPNGSRIKIGGMFNGGDGLRGVSSHGSAIDEAGQIPQHNPTSCLMYCVASIVQPTLLTTKGWCVLLTTPPPEVGIHDYYKMKVSAETDGRFIRFTIFDNTSLTAEEIEEIRQECYTSDPSGGTWAREYLCQPKPDSRALIIPESTQEALANNIFAYPKAEHYELLHKYVAFDHGTVDLNACLFGYYDFLQAKLIVEKELMIPGGSTSKVIAAKIAEAKNGLWGKEAEVERAIGDAISPQILTDINSDLGAHGIHFNPPLKTVLVTDQSGREGMVNGLINGLGGCQIVIDPSCVKLLETIRTATWTVSPKTGKREFGRFENIGHADFLAALMYMWKHVYRNIDPLAGRVSSDIYTTWVTKPGQRQGAAHTLGRALNKTLPRNIFAKNPFGRK